MPNYLDNNVENNMSLSEILKELTDKEIEFREERAALINLTISNFPYHKKLKDFDFSYQPGVNKNQIQDLCSLRFLETNDNILFIGSSGVGKTHQLHLEMEASSRRVSTYFIHFTDLMNKIKKAITKIDMKPL